MKRVLFLALLASFCALVVVLAVVFKPDWLMDKNARLMAENVRLEKENADFRKGPGIYSLIDKQFQDSYYKADAALTQCMERQKELEESIRSKEDNAQLR